MNGGGADGDAVKGTAGKVVGTGALLDVDTVDRDVGFM